MRIPPVIKKPLWFGASAGLLHALLCLAIFVSVQSSTDGQAGFAWFVLFSLDYPTGQIAYELLGSNWLMSNLIDWWYTVGNHQGPNIRSLILLGIFGTLHWFIITALVTAALQRIRSFRHGNQ
jgi:hypothetical protein